jgi:hypothetical protein
MRIGIAEAFRGMGNMSEGKNDCLIFRKFQMDNTCCTNLNFDSLNEMFEMNPKLKKIDAYDFGEPNKATAY